MKRANNILVIGVTGGFGSGKSTVSKMFKTAGSIIINADKLAHKCLKKGSPANKKLVAHYGKDILNSTDGIDRKVLADIAFKNKKNLKIIEHIIHPAVIKTIKKCITSTSRMPDRRIIVIDAPLLIESGLCSACDTIIVVKADMSERIRRIKKNFDLTDSEIAKRIARQLSDKDKIKHADYIVDTNCSINGVKSQVRDVLFDLKIKERK